MLNKISHFICILCLWSAFDLCDCYKILVVFPVPGRSHVALGDSCVQLLLDAGHKVTYLKWGLDFVEQHENLTLIDVSVFNVFEQRHDIKLILNDEITLGDTSDLTKIMSAFERKIMEHDNINKFINNSEENFDIAILEWFYSEYIVGLPAIFGCPYIWFWSMNPHSIILSLIGDTTNPSYTAMNFFKSIPPFSFIERVKSLRDQVFTHLHRELCMQPVEEMAYKKFVAPLIAKRWGVVPTYNELRYNASLVLGNSHFSLGTSFNLPQAYKTVGGYHVEKNNEPLSKDLAYLMDSATDGIIYFSMGSCLKSKDLPNAMTEKLLDIFSELKQTVLWKFEVDLPKRPRNVHIVSWAPQQSILAHPNCVIFISHCGQLSTLEAVHYGIPVIGIPVFADQHKNAKILTMLAMVKEVNLHNLTVDLKAAINEVLTNSSYAEAAKRQSSIYHHRLVPPRVELVYWVEHAIRTNGAAHLRSVSLIVPWYQKWYLDLVVVAISVAFLLILIVKGLTLLILSRRLKPDVEKKMQ